MAYSQHNSPFAKKRVLKKVVSQLNKASKMHAAQADKIESYIEESSPLDCWKGYKRKPGTKEFSKGSCVKVSNSPATKKKQKGGGTTKTCLPKSKIDNMSKEKKDELVRAKKSSGSQGKYKRSSKTNVKGARKKGATLRDWFEKEDWRRVDDPSKKCGE